MTHDEGRLLRFDVDDDARSSFSLVLTKMVCVDAHRPALHDVRWDGLSLREAGEFVQESDVRMVLRGMRLVCEYLSIRVQIDHCASHAGDNPHLVVHG